MIQISTQVDPDGGKPIVTEIKLDIDTIKPEYGGHLERYKRSVSFLLKQRIWRQLGKVKEIIISPFKTNNM